MVLEAGASRGGCASAVTVLAHSAIVADAAATAIANATFIDSVNVVQVAAKEINPNSDISELQVTVQIGALTSDEIQQSLQQGFERAQALVNRNLISGAIIAVQNHEVQTPGIESFVATHI